MEAQFRHASPGSFMLFRPDHLSLGLVLPIQPRQANDIDFNAQLSIARLADELGFAALWVRDVPLNSDSYPDPVGHSDPWVLLGALAATTSRIDLVTGAIVLPLRHPLHVAKAALSLQALSAGRFVLGLGSGDRPSEFAVFGRDHDRRKELFRDNWQRLAAGLAGDGVVLDADGEMMPGFGLRPRSENPVPMLAVGSSAQSLEWIARNAIGWATYHRELSVQRDRIGLWHKAIGKITADFRSFSQSMVVDLADRADQPAEPVNLGYRTGRSALIDILGELRELGTHHVMFNIVENGRPASEILSEIATDIMPAVR
jgi:luciferase-type oxidoreductase